ncbi:MAG: hypothetical protein LBH09_07280 [Peptococcaceae bacterium]|jgi:hypothetical protein|nr:hypothetical protein [Peptococcaceae bacterium]
MKHHYIVQAIMGLWSQEFLCPMGAQCLEAELGGVLKHLGVKRYRIKSIDEEVIADWENSEWVTV